MICIILKFFIIGIPSKRPSIGHLVLKWPPVCIFNRTVEAQLTQISAILVSNMAIAIELMTELVMTVLRTTLMVYPHDVVDRGDGERRP
ncbi:hypothetical protein KP509_20G030300 [Ceratopteris richardii]|nr:hypothetical protein KP509_20G030300 [Ceratopteris richardii]